MTEIDDDVKMVLLLKTEDYLRAQFLVGALEEEGIPTVTKRLGLGDRTGYGSITHVVPDPPRPAEIFVNPADLEKAKEIMESMTSDDSEEEV